LNTALLGLERIIFRMLSAPLPYPFLFIGVFLTWRERFVPKGDIKATWERETWATLAHLASKVPEAGIHFRSKFFHAIFRKR